MHVHVREFTDPACPFAFSVEPSIWRLRWLYGPGLDWETRMVVLSESPEDYDRRGFTVEKQSEGLKMLQARYGMPIDWRMRPRMTATVHPCRAIVATRLHSPADEWRILRSLRVRHMAGEMIDEPATIDAAARDAGIEPRDLRRWLDDPGVEETLREDIRAARRPSPPSRSWRGRRCRCRRSRWRRSWESSPPTRAPSWPAWPARRRSGRTATGRCPRRPTASRPEAPPAPGTARTARVQSPSSAAGSPASPPAAQARPRCRRPRRARRSRGRRCPR